jgi:ATP-dependent Clp protease ATP-binding subunit ClpA
VLKGFSRSAPDAFKRARDIAATDGFDTVEAEHLLLALTQQADEPTTRALDTLGITEAAVRAALDSEFIDALQTVGVAATRRPSRRGRSRPKWGQSAKLVLERTRQVAVDRRDKRMDTRHLLLALSHAEAGVIPRVLRTLDVSASDIDAALR